MDKIRVGILRGGAGEHYNSSLKKGGEIITHILENLADKYKPIDILIDQDYVWHFGGVPINPSDLMNKVDVVWNTLHPSFSNILQSLSIPNISNGSFLSALENNSEMLRKHMKSIGVAMPMSVVLPVYQKDFDGPREKYAIKKALVIFEKFGSPWVVKTFTEDSNMGIHLAKTFPELVNAVEDGVAHQKSILIEEFIAGKVATIHSVPEFHGEDIYTFPLGSSYADRSKLGEAGFSSIEKEKLINLAKYFHHYLGAKHYLKSDFILNPRGKIYLLKIDPMPNLKKDSAFHEVCEQVGAKAHHVVDHILDSVLNRK